MSIEFDFFYLNELLLNMGAVSSPAELQGVLCGKLCGVNTLSQKVWTNAALEFMDLQHMVPSAEQTEAFEKLYQLTVRLMEDVNFSFAPMLPSDESTIARRTEELGYWCQGFLHGVGTSGLAGDAQFSPEAAEALRDLAQISQVSLEESDNVEENEAYWQELVEYVKVAVLTLYTELSNTPTHESKKVH